MRESLCWDECGRRGWRDYPLVGGVTAATHARPPRRAGMPTWLGVIPVSPSKAAAS